MNNPSLDIAFSIHAGRDLRNIQNYITRKASASAARKIIIGIFSAVEILRTYPERYPPEPLLTQYGNFRVIMKGKYKIFYEYTGQEIIILRVIHSRRDLKKIFEKFKP